MELKEAFLLGQIAAAAELPGSKFSGAYDAAIVCGIVPYSGIEWSFFLAGYLYKLPRPIVCDADGVILSIGGAK